MAALNESSRFEVLTWTLIPGRNQFGPPSSTQAEATMTIPTRNDASENSSRRSFLKRSTACRPGGRNTGGAAAVAAQEAARPPALPPGKRFIGIQVGAVSFVDEGVDRVLDILQERAGVNALMLAVFTYGRGIAGRQVPGHPCRTTVRSGTTRTVFMAGITRPSIPSFTPSRSLRIFARPTSATSTCSRPWCPKQRARK